MMIVYDTMTGNTRRFVKKLSEITDVTSYSLRNENIPEGKFLLITHTIGKGEVPETTRKLISERKDDVLGVCSSGSIHWGNTFAIAADVISQEIGVPAVLKFNKSGTVKDLEIVRSWIECNG